MELIDKLIPYINILEVKDVDLDKEIHDMYKRDNSTLKTEEQYAKITKHFFELGCKIQNCNNKCKDLKDDGVCDFASTKLGRIMHCENISCSRRNKVQKE